MNKLSGLSREDFIAVVCKMYDVKYEITDKLEKGQLGCSRPWDNLIRISRNCNRFRWPDVVFHEIAHCMNYRNKKYYRFHSRPGNQQDPAYLRRIHLRAEVYTDKVAAKLAKENGYGYIPCYAFTDSWREQIREKYKK
jgi:hypothetical protein